MRPVLADPDASRGTRWRLAAGSLAVLTALTAVSGCSGDEPYVAPSASPHTDDPRPVTAAETLQRLEHGLSTSDEDAVTALGEDETSRRLLSAVAGNAAALRLSGVGLHYLSETGEVTADGGWTATVEVSWRDSGFDRSPGRTTVAVSFGPDGATVAGIGPYDDAMPLWLTGPLTVRRSATTLVVAADPSRKLAAYVGEAQVAVREVRDVLGDRAKLVVEVPGSVDALNRAVGADPGTYDGIAAVTASSDGSQAPDSAVHVFLNPVVYGGLDRVAAQVVMTHEATHAATGAPLVQGAPLWLLEGFADYVALHDTNLPFTRTAAQITAEVRQDGLPEELPSAPEFDSHAAHLGAVYEAAWLVCVTLADHGGQDDLVRLYDAVIDGQGLDRALDRFFGWSVADLTAAWRERLAALAGVPESPGA